MELTVENVRAAIGSTYQNKIECVKLAYKLKVHAMGMVPKELIEERRPKESEEIKAYREKIYVPKTKNPISKVISSLAKIRRSQDWVIQYDQNANPSSVTDDETLQRYCEEDYPTFDSVTNWAFAELLRFYLIDPNGIVAIIPEKIPDSPSEYLRPVAKFFECDQIVDYVEGEYVVLLSRDTTTYYTQQGKGLRKNTNGAIYYVLTENEFAKYEQIGRNEFTEASIYRHNIGYLPAFKAGGLFKKRINNDTIYESRISGMIADLDEAAREYSDLQAEIVMHIHSEKYAYSNAECPRCHGTGRVHTGEKDENGRPVIGICPDCQGHGTVLNSSPYGVTIISAAKAGEMQLPTPPIGYVQKSAEIAKLQDERVRQHIYDALAAVNMEFLAESPISQSGVAKAYDKDELNNFVNDIAEDIVRILDNVYYFICEYRYNVIVPSSEQRRLMLPRINVPTRYDLLNTSTLMTELTAARKAKVNPLILKHLEIDYARKQFAIQPEIGDLVAETFTLDPLFGIDEENKMTMLQNGGIREIDYIVSCNIYPFVQRAVDEYQDFYTFELKRKQEILYTYAEEIQKEDEEKAKASAMAAFNMPDEEEEVEEEENEPQEDEEEEGEEVNTTEEETSQTSKKIG